LVPNKPLVIFESKMSHRGGESEKTPKSIIWMTATLKQIIFEVKMPIFEVKFLSLCIWMSLRCEKKVEEEDLNLISLSLARS
jgi:hypothetical protein